MTNIAKEYIDILNTYSSKEWQDLKKKGVVKIFTPEERERIDEFLTIYEKSLEIEGEFFTTEIQSFIQDAQNEYDKLLSRKVEALMALIEDKTISLSEIRDKYKSELKADEQIRANITKRGKKLLNEIKKRG